MKPVERDGFISVWICVKQGTDGRFFLDTTVSSEFGSGMFKSEQDAQHHQTICLLKNEKVQVFKLDWPL
jgi:hypothetical protein